MRTSMRSMTNAGQPGPVVVAVRARRARRGRCPTTGRGGQQHRDHGDDGRARLVHVQHVEASVPDGAVDARDRARRDADDRRASRLMGIGIAVAHGDEALRDRGGARCPRAPAERRRRQARGSRPRGRAPRARRRDARRDGSRRRARSTSMASRVRRACSSCRQSSLSSQNRRHQPAARGGRGCARRTPQTGRRTARR